MKKITKAKVTKIKAKLEERAIESKGALDWFRNRWAQFEYWFHNKYLPGLKTRLVLYGAFISSTVAVLQEYITQLPLEKFISAGTVAIVGMGLALLAIWFRGMGERVNVEEHLKERFR